MQFYSWGRVGLGEPIVENAILKSWDLNTQLDKIIPLRPSLFRIWISTDFLYDSSGNPTTHYVPLFNQAIDRLYNAGIQVMGMQHSFPPWMTGADGTRTENWNTIPCLSSSVQHKIFLDKYEANWKRMAKLFPKVAVWEPANETNGIETLKPIQTGAGSCGKTHFTHDEHVWITIELMERAHRAIKSVNPSTLVFMPPPGPQNDELALTGEFGSVDVELVTIRRFIEDIYSTIASWNGNARNYFDGISWHPYIFQDASMDTWVKANKNIYDVIASYGDARIHIILSEVGNSDMNYSPQTRGLASASPKTLSSWMQNTIRLTQSHMPWVSHLIWFRVFDDQSARVWGGDHQVKFGIYTYEDSEFKKKDSVDVICKFTGCVDEPFRAFGPTGWKTYRLEQRNTFCEFISPNHYKARTGMDYQKTLPWLAALDPKKWTFKGYCY